MGGGPGASRESEMVEYTFGVDWADHDTTGLVLFRHKDGLTTILLSVTGEAAEVLCDAMGMRASGPYRLPEVGGRPQLDCVQE